MNWDYLLLYKWIIYNAIGIVLLVIFHDILFKIYSFDPYASPVILGTYFIFLLIGTYRIIGISRSINKLKRGILTEKLDLSRKSIEYHLFSKISVLEYISEVPIRIGLLGTVLGLLLASFVLKDMMGDVSDIQDALRAFTDFLNAALIAFVSTAVGMVTELWLRLLMVFVRNGVGTQIELISKIQKEEK